MVLDTPLARDVGIEVPLICGAMYPCSNPELVAAVSEAGGVGVVQPVSLTYVHGYDFRSGLQFIRTLTMKPIGMNALIEQSSKVYRRRMEGWIEVALEEGVRFFITSLGNPRWVVDRVASAGGRVYHDVTERKWAIKALEAGVHGLIAVNRRAGGHPGSKDSQELWNELEDFHVPVVCAGGIGNETGFVDALRAGYVGAQLGTRFIATPECHASGAYKSAIVNAREDDVVLTERISGIPVSVIRTQYVERIGLEANPVARWLLRYRRTKHLMRSIYALLSLSRLKDASLGGGAGHEYWQAGKSVRDVGEILPVKVIVRRFAEAARVAQWQ